jgi:DNA-directed RNA polymerase subunit RPC12/RpoP
MSISVACPTCGSKFRVLEKYAGNKMKCPDCGKPFAVPDTDVKEFEVTSPARAPSRRRDREEDDFYEDES